MVTGGWLFNVGRLRELARTPPQAMEKRGNNYGLQPTGRNIKESTRKHGASVSTRYPATCYLTFRRLHRKGYAKGSEFLWSYRNFRTHYFLYYQCRLCYSSWCRNIYLLDCGRNHVLYSLRDCDSPAWPHVSS